MHTAKQSANKGKNIPTDIKETPINTRNLATAMSCNISKTSTLKEKEVFVACPKSVVQQLFENISNIDASHER
jgi:hypothetical protein